MMMKPEPHSDNTALFARDCNAFAVAMYRRLQQRGENLFFSPFSLWVALGMAAAGARGETAVQMGAVLYAAQPGQGPRVIPGPAIRRFNVTGGEYELCVANSLWGQDGAQLQPSFVEIMACYEGSLNFVDFRTDAEAGRVAINEWVKEKTRQKICDLVPEGQLSASTRMILVNGVYFKGGWELKFPKELTRDEPFYREDRGAVIAPLMKQQAVFRYMEAEDYQAIELAYRGANLSMLVILPDREVGLEQLENRLTEGMLDDCVERLGNREVMLFLPRFKFTGDAVDVRDHLVALGMPLAFAAGQADFSGINGLRPPHPEALFIDALFQNASVETNEEGSEATAFGALLMASLGVSPPVAVFRADHPFLYAVRDRDSGAILFLGRVTDPTTRG